MSVRTRCSKVLVGIFGLTLINTAAQAQSDVKAEINFLNGAKEFKALLKAEPLLTADRTLLLPDANGTLMLNANPGIGGTGMLYGVTGAQNTATVGNYLFNVQYAAGAGAATGALITSASTGAGALGLDVVATGGAGTATGLRLAASGGATNYAIDVVTGDIRIQSTLPTTTTGTAGLVLEGGIVMTRTITTVDAGTTINTTLRWDGTKWVENVNLTSTSTGNTAVGGTLGVTGATTLSSTLGVTGAATLSSTLGVTGATTLSSTLGVTGAATLSSTLGVTGAATFSSTVTANDNVTVAGGKELRLANGTPNYNAFKTGAAQVTDVTYTLPTAAPTASQVLRANATTPTNLEWATLTTVDAGTTTNSTLRWNGTKWVENLNLTSDASGNTAVAGTLGVTGATTLSSTLGVTGATTLSSTLGVTGAATLSSTLGVTGATTLSSTLGVTGATTLSSTLGVTGATTLSSTLGVTGATTLSSTLDVTGATTLSSTVAVTGTTTLKGTSILEPTTPAALPGTANAAITVGATYVKQDVTVNTSGATKTITLPAGTADGQLLMLRLNITNSPASTGKISFANSNATVIETVNNGATAKRFYQFMYSSTDSQWMILSSTVIP